MQIGFGQAIITPIMDTEMVGYTPRRNCDGIEKDIYVKAVSLVDNDKTYTWITGDILGFDLFFQDQLLKTLDSDGITIEHFQMFSSHTHSAPKCLNEAEYNSPNTKQSEIDYFDYLLKQAKTAIVTSINSKQDFTYKYAHGKMENFQTNRINKDAEAFDDILVIEISQADANKSLLYSFAGHPTILDSKSTLISPDYVGVISQALASDYTYNLFFNAPCGDMSTRYTKRESSIAELERLGMIAYENIRKTLTNLSESKQIKNYKFTDYTYDLKVKDFLSIERAQKLYDESLLAYNNGLADKLDKYALRALRGTLEGNMINLHHSKQGYTMTSYPFNYSIVEIDGYKFLNLSGEIFTSLVSQLNLDKVWPISLSNQYRTYLCDKQAFDANTYEALSSLFEKGQAELMMDKINKDLI